MATIVETKDLLQTVVASLVAGVGITVVFSVAIWGTARFVDLSRSGRTAAAWAAVTLAAFALLASLMAVGFGVMIVAGG